MWTKNSTFRRARVQAVLRGRLERLGLAGHPGFRFRAGLEGYADYVFGARAGPSVDTYNLFHELAHAAQFGPELFRQRTCRGSFVFKMRRVTVFGQRYAEPLTSGATQRELLTFAHQLRLMHLAGCKVTPRAFFAEATRSMAYMPDWYNVPGDDAEQRHAFCAQRAQQLFEQQCGQDSLKRLRGWLDLTAKRLARAQQKPELPEGTFGLSTQGQWVALS